MDIGGRIRAARKRAGLSQDEVARRTGMSLNGMANIERGHIPDPHVSSVRRIADALGVSVGELVGEPVLAGKAEAPEAGRPGEELSIALSEKLQRQLDDQLRIFGERKSIARSDEDLHEAAKDFQHWWLIAFDWLSVIVREFPEAADGRLKAVVDAASQSVKDEYTPNAPNPRHTPDMADVVREWHHEEARRA
jgi:transcriptional regulator with XRE-family HTH domain